MPQDWFAQNAPQANAQPQQDWFSANSPTGNKPGRIPTQAEMDANMKQGFDQREATHYTGPAPDQSNGPSIQARPDNPVRNWLEDAKSDIENGTGLTAVGKLLGHGGSRPGGYENGKYVPGKQTGTAPTGTSPAAELMAGPAIGPFTAAHGVADIPEHPVKGVNEALRGVAQTAAIPMAVANPGFAAEALPYFGAQQGASFATSLITDDPDYQELVGNLAIPGAHLSMKGMRGVAKLAMAHPQFTNLIMGYSGVTVALHDLFAGRPLDAAKTAALTAAVRAAMPEIANSDIPNPLHRGSMASKIADQGATEPRFPKAQNFTMSGLKPGTPLLDRIMAAKDRLFGRKAAPAPESTELGPAEIIPPNRKGPGEVAPEQVGTQPTNPNILAGNQGVRVKPTQALPAAPSPRGELPEQTARPMPARTDTSMEPDILRRRIEVTGANPEQQGHDIRAYLDRNPHASPQQIREAIFSAIDSGQLGAETGGIGEALDTRNATPGRITKHQPAGPARNIPASGEIEPGPQSTFPRIDNGYSAAAYALTYENEATLAQFARNRGIPFQPGGETHASLMSKLLDSLTPREVSEFEAAAVERSRNVSPRPEMREYNAEQAARRARGPQPQVPTDENTADLLQQSIAQAQAKKGIQPEGTRSINDLMTKPIQVGEPEPEPQGLPLNIAAPHEGPAPIGGKIRTPEEMAADRQRSTQAERVIRAAGLETAPAGAGISRDLDTVTFNDPAHPNKPVLMKLDEVMQGGPEAVKAKMQERLSQQEPPRAGAGEKRTEEAPGVARAVVPASQFQRGDTGFADPREIKLRPKDFQYKSNVNEKGITNQFVGQGFNEDLMGVVHVFKDPQTGELVAVNGHHRVELAQRSNAPKIRIHVLDTDNPVRAKALGALQNIAEGQGSNYDAAVFFKDSKTSPADLKAAGVSLSAPKVDAGMALKNLDRSILDKVGTGEIPEGRATAIGKATDDPATQEGILKLIEQEEKRGKTISDARVAEMARIAQSVGNYTENTLSLFGAENRVNSLLSDVADISAHIKRELSRERVTFGAVASEGRAKKLGQVEGQAIKAKENAAISRQAAQALELFDKLSVTKGPVNDLLVSAARRIRNGEKPQAVKEQAFKAIRQEVSRALPGGQAGSGPIAEADQSPR